MFRPAARDLAVDADEVLEELRARPLRGAFLALLLLDARRGGLELGHGARDGFAVTRAGVAVGLDAARGRAWAAKSDVGIPKKSITYYT